ncbi:MAG: DUF6531 domain-containing protein, partial [Eubacteriales bacterium]
GDVLADIADFYYYGDSNSNAFRQQKIITGTSLPMGKYIQTDWYLLIKDPTIEGVYSPYTDPASLPKPVELTMGNPDQSTPVGPDPVNPATGNFFTEKQDLVITGKGLPLEFTRTYN